MKTAGWFICLLVYSVPGVAQTLEDRLSKAAEKFLSDPQMKHGIVGLQIVKSATGEKVFELNAQTGLAPASCQKTITGAAAMEMLGSGYRYQTVAGYSGTIVKGVLKGDLYISGTGDPSLGSWRYDATKEEKQLDALVDMIQKAGIKKIEGNLIGLTGNWEEETLPGGWIWDDMGNYYGAGTAALNWHENQYDLILRSGQQLGDTVTIVSTKPYLYGITLHCRLTAAAKGTGDNAYIYLPPYATHGYVRGTIPVAENAFIISGSIPDPAQQFLYTLNRKLDSVKILPKQWKVSTDKNILPLQPIGTVQSPTLDSLNYWFMKKSINLYGEAFLKTIAYEKTGLGSTDKGVSMVKQFWKERGIEPSALHIIDGSGLSPQNRVTADALVKVLQYARTRPWFAYYHDALPVFNQMKLKSGTIGGAKSFAGYHTAKDGTTYTVAMMVNNYDGSAGEMVKKMYQLLDELK